MWQAKLVAYSKVSLSLHCKEEQLVLFYSVGYVACSQINLKEIYSYSSNMLELHFLTEVMFTELILI